MPSPELAHVFGGAAAGQQGFTVVEGIADQLVAAADDLLIAEAAGHRQRQLVILGLLHQVQHPLQLVARLAGLAIEALGQQHCEFGRVHLEHAADHRRVDTLGT
jgi:hypothetical protein